MAHAASLPPHKQAQASALARSDARVGTPAPTGGHAEERSEGRTGPNTEAGTGADTGAPSSTPVREAKAAQGRHDYIAARRLLEQAAADGDVEVADMLGHMLLFGRGGPIDTRRAVTLLRDAAVKGSLEAQNSLGIMYMPGLNGELSLEKGVSWFKIAAKGGHSSAQYNMGRACEQGIGTPRSPEEASKWYTLAAQSGNEMAQKRLDELQMTDRLATLSPEQQAMRGTRSYAGESILEARRRDNTTAMYSELYRRQPAPPAATPPKPRASANAPTGRPQADPAKGERFATTPMQMGTQLPLLLDELHLSRKPGTERELEIAFTVRNRGSVTLSDERNGERNEDPIEGLLSFVMHLPDGTAIPLSVEEPSFSVRNFVHKNYRILLPPMPTDGARIEISARRDSRILATGHVLLPAIRAASAAPAKDNLGKPIQEKTHIRPDQSARPKPDALRPAPPKSKPAPPNETPAQRRQRLLNRIME